MAKHIKKRVPLRWAGKFWPIPPSARDKAVNAAMFTDYPHYVSSRAMDMGYNVKITALSEIYAPFKYLLITLDE